VRPEKKLKKFEEENFTTASMGWDTHTFPIKDKLGGYDEACTDWDKWIDECPMDKKIKIACIDVYGGYTKKQSKKIDEWATAIRKMLKCTPSS